MEEQKEGLPK